MASAQQATVRGPIDLGARAYVVPFAVLIAFLAATAYLPGGIRFAYAIRTVAVAAAVLLYSRPLLRSGPKRLYASAGLGVLVFALWITPDLLFPSLRQHWLFSNSLTGTVPAGGVAPVYKDDLLFLFFRVAGSFLIVPIAEELFWRGFLMRWLIDKDFNRLPIGAYAPEAFWITTLLFASEHGSYWDVGLLAGIAYNLWMVRTRSLADCILAHAVTNGLLAIYVIGWGRWEYWL